MRSILLVLPVVGAAVLASCETGPAPVALSPQAAQGEAIFTKSTDNLKRATNCAAFYRNVGRFANNPMEDVPGNLDWWTKRLATIEPDAARQAQLNAYVDAMITQTFGPRPGRGSLDSLQQGANYEYQVRQCLSERRELEGASAG